VTVAAVILAASPESALADAHGLPSVRRIADIAWSGGASPIIVVSSDPDGAVRAALAGAPVTLAEPAPPERGPAAQMARGIEVAIDEVRETSAALLWPSRMTWVGPETVTSLIEAHGVTADRTLTPSYEGAAGWPVLVPVAALEVLRATPPDRMPDKVLDHLHASGVGDGPLQLGDPGTVHDRSTPRTDLPAYTGPTAPAGGHAHEWGSVAADEPDDGPLEGPALAPFGQAASDTEPG
jgi:CTP:molybdopterin cytidylyltransferase MocA